MAAFRIFLGAENHGLPELRETDQAGEPLHEIRSQRAAIVIDGAVLPIELSCIRTTAELSPQVDVVHVVPAEPLLQAGSVEVRCPLRVRL